MSYFSLLLYTVKGQRHFFDYESLGFFSSQISC